MLIGSGNSGGYDQPSGVLNFDLLSTSILFTGSQVGAMVGLEVAVGSREGDSEGSIVGSTVVGACVGS